MPKLLIFLTLPERIRNQYRDKIGAKFPELEIDVAGTREEAVAAIPEADYLLTFGAMMRDELYKPAKKLKWVQALGTGVDLADATRIDDTLMTVALPEAVPPGGRVTLAITPISPAPSA